MATVLGLSIGEVGNTEDVARLATDCAKVSTCYDKIVGFVGARCQSACEDFTYKIEDEEPARLLIIEETFANLLEANLDTTLLSDVLQGEKYAEVVDYGSNFKKAIGLLGEDSRYPSEPEPSHLLELCQDDQTFLILYLQIHKIAKDNPDDEIFFNFYSRENLSHYFSFFSKFNFLIPNNLKFQLNKFDENGITPFSTITGAGICDREFNRTILKMVRNLDISDQDLESEAPTTETFLGLQLINLQAIEDYFKTLNTSSAHPDAKITEEFKTKITNEMNEYNNLPNYVKIQPKATYLLRKKCLKHLNEWDGKLSAQSSYKPIALNFLLLLSIVGAPFALMSVANRAVNGNYLFFANAAHSKHKRLNNFAELIDANPETEHPNYRA